MQILLPTFDDYNFLVPPNIACLRRAWPRCPWEIVVVNGGKRQIHLPEDKKIRVLYLEEDKNYGANLIAAIDALITDEHLLLWLDDYMLYFMDKSMLDAGVSLVKEPGIGSVRLSQMYTPIREPLEKDGRFTYIDMKAQYSFSQQAALWDTNVFRGNLRAGEDPWETELNGSGRIEHSENGDFPTFLGVLSPTLNYHNILNKGVFDENATQWLFSLARWS